MTQKDSGTAENPARPQIVLKDIHIILYRNYTCSVHLASPTTLILSDLDFDLSRAPTKVKSNVQLDSPYMMHGVQFLSETYRPTRLVFVTQDFKI